MKHIIVAIDCGPVYCEMCIGVWLSGSDAECDQAEYDGSAKRGPLCLEAERKLAAIVEAGERVANTSRLSTNQWVDGGAAVNAWDRTVADIKEERK